MSAATDSSGLCSLCNHVIRKATREQSDVAAGLRLDVRVGLRAWSHHWNCQHQRALYVNTCVIIVKARSSQCQRFSNAPQTCISALFHLLIAYLTSLGREFRCRKTTHCFFWKTDHLGAKARMKAGHARSVSRRANCSEGTQRRSVQPKDGFIGCFFHNEV